MRENRVAHEDEDEEIWAMYIAEDLYDEFLNNCPRDQPTRGEVDVFVSSIVLTFFRDLREAASFLREIADEFELQVMEQEGEKVRGKI